MLEAVKATYDGKNFVPDEKLDLPHGEKAIVTIWNDDTPKYFESAKRKVTAAEEIDNFLEKTQGSQPIDFKKFAGAAGHLFGSKEKIDEYVRSLRNEDRF